MATHFIAAVKEHTARLAQMQGQPVSPDDVATTARAVIEAELIPRLVRVIDENNRKINARINAKVGK